MMVPARSMSRADNILSIHQTQSLTLLRQLLPLTKPNGVSWQWYAPFSLSRSAWINGHSCRLPYIFSYHPKKHLPSMPRSPYQDPFHDIQHFWRPLFLVQTAQTGDPKLHSYYFTITLSDVQAICLLSANRVYYLYKIFSKDTTVIQKKIILPFV